MGKQTESTAINQLINLVATQGPSVKDPGNDLFSSPPTSTPKASQPDLFARPSARMSQTIQGAPVVEPLPRGRAPMSTQHNIAAIPPPPPPAARASRQMAIPPVPPSPAIDVSSTLRGSVPPPRPSLPPPARRTLETPAVAAPPYVATPLPVAPTPSIAQLTGPHARVDMTGQSMFAERGVENTSRMRTPGAVTSKDLLKRLALPAFAVIVLGGSIGGYLAMSSKSNKASAAVPTQADANVAVKSEAIAAPIEAGEKATAPAAIAAITTAPPTAEVPAHPTLVDVRIDSTPSGATVTLIDNGKSMFLGSTPINAAVDPSRTYEIQFSYPGGQSQTAKLDPKTTQRLAVVLAGAKPVEKTVAKASEKRIETPAPKAVEAPAPKKADAPKATRATKVAKVEKTAAIVEPDFEAPTAEKSEKVVEKVEKADKVAKADAAEGVLMISSKPPCEIVVDGKPTGLMTPQRAMKLPVGKHRITLINQDKDLQMTVPVDIKADKPTKVIQNLLGSEASE